MTDDIKPESSAYHLADYPALATLRLRESDLLCLQHQGFLRAEAKSCRTVFKLRFRRDRVQVVRYIGTAHLADAVRDELERLQATRRLQSRLAVLSREARRMIRDTKANQQAALAACGYKYHGHAIRRTRRPPAA